MKSKILIIIALCFAKMLFAQDSIRVETVTDTAFKTPQYVSVYDDVFLSHKETKWLLKADLMGALNEVFDNPNVLRPSSIEFERKMGQTMSLNMGVSMPLDIIDVLDFNSSGDRVTALTYILEPRYFFGMKKKAKVGQLSNNLNGNYISLRGGITQNFLKLGNDASKGYSSELKLEKWHLSINYGMQRRVFNNFYVHFKVGLAMTDIEVLTGQVEYPTNFIPPYPITRIKSKETAYGFDNQFTIGLAFGGGKKQIVNNTCDLFRCFEEEHQLFKIDIKQLLGKLDNRNISSKIILGYEIKLENSPVSLNTALNGGFDQVKDKSFPSWKGVLGLGRLNYGYTLPNLPSLPQRFSLLEK